jgi:hypothetical protein
MSRVSVTAFARIGRGRETADGSPAMVDRPRHSGMPTVSAFPADVRTF